VIFLLGKIIVLYDKNSFQGMIKEQT